MFPGGRGMNAKQLARMMKQMGIEVEDLEDVQEVVIRTADKEYVFDSAEVTIMRSQGTETWQVVGEPEERPRGSAAPAAPAKPAFTEEDVDLVASQAGVDKAAARKALEATGGAPAEAILKLVEGK
ncbi:MAG TPA: nascent polypeptide-associated complex protein [Candidatus Thermoplasmatota archaeon]|nr:nascent polypeptide-associated complex protein [Candidatus Thermoplasmatota archaeon]